MSEKNRVLWSEGLFLRPQHFQQQERYWEHLLDSRVRPLMAYGYGLLEFKLDQDMLRHGRVAIARARGVFQDGSVFDIPDEADAPEPLLIESDCKDVIVALCLPYRRPGMPEMSCQPNRDALLRYDGADQQVNSAVLDHPASADVKVGRLRLKLQRLSEVGAGYVALGLVRVVEKRNDGQLIIDDSYIPPLLNCRESSRVYAYIKDVAALLKHRAQALAYRVSQPGVKGVAEMSDFLLLQACNKHTPLMLHLLQQALLHPVDLFRQLLQLAGEVSTFGRQERLAIAFPDYDHDNLQLCFEPVVEEIRRTLTAVLEQNAIAIPLIERARGLYVGDIPDPALLVEAAFVLAIKSELAVEQMNQQLPSQIKMGPVEKIRELIVSHLPGIPVRHLPVAPRQIPYQAGYSYFELQKDNEYWKSIQVSMMIALHLAGDFPGLSIEMWAIKIPRI